MATAGSARSPRTWRSTPRIGEGCVLISHYFPSSCPALSRGSTNFQAREAKTWMAGTSPAMTRRWSEQSDPHDALRAVLLSLRRDVRGVGLHGHRREEPGARRAVSHPRLLQRRRLVRAARRRVSRHDPRRRLCRCGDGAVPVRGHDARRRLRRASSWLPQISADRRYHRHRASHRADPRAACLGDGTGNQPRKRRRRRLRR